MTLSATASGPGATGKAVGNIAEVVETVEVREAKMGPGDAFLTLLWRSTPGGGRPDADRTRIDHPACA